MPALGERRKGRFQSQQELAEKATVGKSTINDIEYGRRVPESRTARAIAEALSVDPGEIDWPEPLAGDTEKQGIQ